MAVVVPLLAQRGQVEQATQAVETGELMARTVTVVEVVAHLLSIHLSSLLEEVVVQQETQLLQRQLLAQVVDKEVRARLVAVEEEHLPLEQLPQAELVAQEEQAQQP